MEVGAIQYKDSIIANFPHLFTGLGKMSGAYNIMLNNNTKPFILTTPRTIPIPLLSKLRAELHVVYICSNLESSPESRNQQTSVQELSLCQNPTEKLEPAWVDLNKLNQSVRRERHIVPSVEQIWAQIGGATFFFKLDANSGLWQIELSRESAALVTHSRKLL